MTTKTAALGVSVVGLGVGEAHARAFAGLKSCRLVSLLDLDRGRAERAALTLKASRTASSFEEIIWDPEVRIISIASYDHDHFGQVKAALECGKHVFAEKPLCRSLRECRALRRAWEKGGRPHLMSNLVLRAAPLYSWLKDAVDSGRLGDLFAVDGDYLYGRLEKITDGWRKDVKDYSVMQGGGVHMVDLLLWLAEERPERVAAIGSRVASRGTSFRYHDYVSAAYAFRGGLIGRITANFGCVHRHQHRLAVYGTKGTFIHDDAGARLHMSRDPSAAPKVLDQAPVPANKGALIPVFVEGILAGRDPEPQLRRELDLIAACTAADRALGTGGSKVVYP